MPQQPIYCTWTAKGRKTHTPGSFRRGRVTEATGWVNAAVGELARIDVCTQNAPARDQKDAALIIYPGEGTIIEHGEDGRITIIKRAPEPESDPDKAPE